MKRVYPQIPRQAKNQRIGKTIAQAAATAPEVPGAGGGEEDPGSAAGQSLTSSHSRNIWTILIHSRTKV